MITPSFSITATERVLPRLALDFTTASLDSRITFTRALNTATRVNSSGYVESVNADTARFDFDPITKVCKGLLIEETRSNLWAYSSDLSQAVWNKTRGSILTDTVVSPDGTQNADTFVEDSQTGNHYVLQAATITAGDTCTSSIFLKAAGRRYVQLLMDANNIVDFVYAYFDLQTGTITQAAQVQGTATGPSASMTDMGNGWYRCTVTAKLGTTSTTGRLFVFPTNVATGAALASIAGLNAASYYVWGGQFEVGAFPTSYIPTTTTSLTRNADVATMTGTNFSSWFNASEGTFGVQLSTPQDYGSGFQTFFTISDGTNANRISAAVNAVANVLNTEMIVSSSAVAGFYPSYVSGATKVCFAYKENNTNYGKDGVSGTTDTSCTVPTLNRVNIGSSAGGGNLLNGHVQRFAYYPQRLINAELAAFSK